ncbi:hypothetical protein HYZ41_01290 [archaeon]|nr:hypothetical protein [archaeon]
MFFRRKDDHDHESRIPERQSYNDNKRNDYNHDLNEIKEAMDIPFEEEPTFRPIGRQPEDQGTPLFVKVDRYKEVLTTIHEMKLFISSVKQMFAVLRELEAVRSDAINIMNATLHRVEKSVLEMDADLLRPKGVSLNDMGIATTEAHHLEDTLTDMQKRIDELKDQLHELK